MRFGPFFYGTAAPASSAGLSMDEQTGSGVWLLQTGFAGGMIAAASIRQLQRGRDNFATVRSHSEFFVRKRRYCWNNSSISD
jgi:hypothetical protein